MSTWKCEILSYFLNSRFFFFEAFDVDFSDSVVLQFFCISCSRLSRSKHVISGCRVVRTSPCLPKKVVSFSAAFCDFLANLNRSITVLPTKYLNAAPRDDFSKTQLVGSHFSVCRTHGVYFLEPLAHGNVKCSLTFRFLTSFSWNLLTWTPDVCIWTTEWNAMSSFVKSFPPAYQS